MFRKLNLPRSGRRISGFILALGAVILMMSSCVSVQSPIQGVVYADTGEGGIDPIPLPRIKVTLQTYDENQEIDPRLVVASDTTDSAGRYAFAPQPPGKYSLCWQQSGWAGAV